MVPFVVVQQAVLQPERGTLADGRRLRRLVVREAQRRQVLVLQGKGRQLVQQVHEFLLNEPQALGHNDDVGVVADVAGRGAEVDNALGVRALQAVGVDVGHDVMAAAFLLRNGVFVVNVILVRPELVNLVLRNGEAQFHFALGKGNPEFSPSPELEVRGEDVLHFLAGVPGIQWGFISVFLHGE